MSKSISQNLPNFNYSIDEIKEKVDECIKEALKRFQEIIDTKENERTFSNTIELLELTQSQVYNTLNPLSFLSLVSPNKELREVALEIKKDFEKFTLNTLTRYDLYSSIKQYQNIEKEKLSDEKERLLDKLLSDFQRNGLNLPTEEQRQKILSIRAEISDICLEITKNINEDNTQLIFKESELFGLPPSFFTQLKLFQSNNSENEGEEKEKEYVVTLAYPHLFPILNFAKNEKTREKILLAFDSKCPQNSPLFLRLLRLRYEGAKLQGYENDAEYMLEIKLAKTVKFAEEFLKNAHSLIKPKLDDELAHLIQLKQSSESSNELTKLNLWDYRYYQQKRIEKNYSLDNEEIRKYFPFESVKNGVLSTYQNVFSLKFTKIDDHSIDIWDPSVECYAVFDRFDDHLIGFFYLDLFPRDGKYKHAACWPVLRRSVDFRNDQITYTASAMVTNFSPPSDDRPSLLTIDEVRTFFHEFGHVMHSVLSKNKYGRLNWTWSAVEQDFLEVPSMMLENWAYQPIVLNDIARHYQTNQILPSDQIERISLSNNANDGYLYCRLIAMSLFDLYIHSSPISFGGNINNNDNNNNNNDNNNNGENNGENNIEAYESMIEGDEKKELRNMNDLIQLWREIMKKYVGSDMQLNSIPFISWHHMVGGYNAGYYGYIYSDIIACDLFTRFEKEGILSAEVGKQFRSFILEPCTLLDGNSMISLFLQRDVSQNAFCTRLGLPVPSPSN